ncbi:MAG TPA: hypothetical protein VEZ40_11610 [Pyrinomonadaceae bacterium]|nr:hypothetical protein [Pyrinomonadaceae bacterium]
MIEKRLSRMAGDANTTTSGGLDTLDTHMMRMPAELHDARKKRIGRHRVYYIGHHHQCSYQCFYIKVNKKKGVDDEDDASFQEKLKSALTEPALRTLSDPTKPNKQLTSQAASNEPSQPS